MASPASTTASHHYPANRRVATLYDAVSGRISSRGFIPSEAAYVQTRDTTTSSLQAVPPEEVLFRRKHAPMRYEEADIYFDTGIPDPSHDPAAHPGGEIKWRKRQQSPPLKRLPDSDLLKALHAYASDFYHRTADAGDAESDWRSLDETALLALGVLIEEEAGRVLGETGDMVFVEAADIVHEREEEADAGQTEMALPARIGNRRDGCLGASVLDRPRSRSSARKAVQAISRPLAMKEARPIEAEESESERRRKRPRLDKEDDGEDGGTTYDSDDTDDEERESGGIESDGTQDPSTSE